MTGGGGLSLSSGRPSRARWVGRASILHQFPNAPQWLRFIVLTVGMAGIQLVWSLEMAQASPYLLSLGLSKALMSLVFLAGPLSGLVVQPLVGVLSDACKSKWGRRRPFMVAGCVASAAAVMLLGWAGEVAGIVSTEGGQAHKTITICLAILAVYVIDFSINVVQAMDRSLLVDVVPPHLQPSANAWASRVFGLSAVLAYYFSSLDLVALTNGALGSTNLKINTVFTSVMLCVCHAVTVFSVQERVLISRETDKNGEEGGGWDAVWGIWDTFKGMPRPIQQVLNIQFASWIGWFPVLFFSTTWVAETYVRNATGSSDLSEAPSAILDLATRAGTRAMFFHSVIAFTTSICLPPLVAPFTPSSGGNTAYNSPYLRPTRDLYRSPGEGQLREWWEWTREKMPDLPLKWLTLPLAWTLGNAVFAACLLVTYWADSVAAASTVIALAGFSWSVTNWAPFSLLGDLILRMSGSAPLLPTPIPLQTRPNEWSSLPPILSPIPELDTPSTDYKATPTSLERYRTPSPSSSTYHDTSQTPTRANPNPHALSTPEQSPHLPSSPGTPATPNLGEGDWTPRKSKRYSLPSSFPADNRPHIYGGSPHPGPGPGESTGSLHHDPYSYEEGEGEGKGGSQLLLVRHSDSFEGSEGEREEYLGIGKDEGAESATEGRAGRGDTTEEESEEWDAEGEEGEGGDQAGVILGCHNLYIVAPQLLVTAFSSLVFALLSTGHSIVHGPPTAAPAPLPPNGAGANEVISGEDILDLVVRAAAAEVVQKVKEWDTLGLIFRCGGVAALVSTWLSWKMARETRRRGR